MKFARLMHSRGNVWATLLSAACVLAPAMAAADEAGPGLVFQKPTRPGTSRATSAPASTASGPQFRATSSATPAATQAQAQSTPAASPAPAPAAAAPAATTAANPLRTTSAATVTPAAAEIAVGPTTDSVVTSTPAASRAAARPIAQASRPVQQASVQQTVAQQAPVQQVARRAPAPVLPSYIEPGQDLSGAGQRRAQAIADASVDPTVHQTSVRRPLSGLVKPVSFSGGCAQGGCAMCGEPVCGVCEEPACGCEEPACGYDEATCGIEEPGCGCAEPTCGSCVGNPGPDYWCFPVCLPRFKDLRFWAGTHGFKGPRDSPLFGGAGDGNFGFQEGVTIGGRAPLISILFPELAYQLGYQAVQSQLAGLSDGRTSDRSQQFVTAGVFRRVRSGVQFGVVWDMLRDDFQSKADFDQLRYEVSLKSISGHEFGFWGASHLNSEVVGGIDYQSVDQYNGFYRYNWQQGSNFRFFVGATNDSEVVIGSDINAPLSDRFLVQTGFNYLITDQPNGTVGAREESWNVGFNIVWVYGSAAKKNNINPFAPLFQTADNGWMFIDRVH